jgi:hypothetical protein
MLTRHCHYPLPDNRWFIIQRRSPALSYDVSLLIKILQQILLRILPVFCYLKRKIYSGHSPPIDNLLVREAKPVVPPYVTYSLTSSGMGLRSVLYAMALWAIEENGEDIACFPKKLEDFPGVA